ncbi:hypothetical protein J2W43_000572 [Pseudomonas brassicacearum]|uniref:Zona occludens toxin N-terminal domain-containing protein n=1 Tax=Pseudomonas brassicacearum TaxID=930166 RepID=A0AAW8M566_9PSED|nr:hypothetical protein [Pseudomonas brassicacearum]MDR6956609.1 hypothetical protein [Pseudomonas brassicacearum]
MTPPKIAYLEISPRQTGKTERLIQLAQPYLVAGRKVCFVTVKGLVEDLRRRLPGAVILEDGEDVLFGEDVENAVWFYDEFDWLNSTRIRADAFYATTPRFQRTAGINTSENDLLLRLIEANNRYFCRYTWQIHMSDILEEARASHSPEEFRLLYLGEFLK